MIDEKQFKSELRKLIASHGSQEAFATAHGLIRQEVGRSLTGVPSRRVAKIMGLRPVRAYEQLEAGEVPPFP